MKLTKEEIKKIISILLASNTDVNDIEEIVDKLKLMQFELSYDNVVDEFKTRDKRGGIVICDHITHGIIKCYLYLNDNNRLMLSNESDLELDLSDLEFLAFGKN